MSEREELANRLEAYAKDWRARAADNAIVLEAVTALRQPPAPVQVTEEMVERVARAICVSDGRDPDGHDIMFICGPNNEPLPCWQGYVEQAESALQAGAPSGWKLVPEEPTKAMRQAFHKANDEYENGNGGTSPDMQWAAMLAAAPAPGEGR